MTMRPLRCQQCAALLQLREGHSLVCCAFCGSSYLLEAPLPTAPAPAARLRPFETTASAARLCVESWLSQGFFRPGDLSRCAVLSDPVPVLVPVYRGRARAHSNWTAAVGRWEQGIDVETLQKDLEDEEEVVATVTGTGDGSTVEPSSVNTSGSGRRRNRVKVQRTTQLMSGTHDEDYKDVVIPAGHGLPDHQSMWLVPGSFDGLVALDANAPPEAALIEEPAFGAEDAEVRLRERIHERERSACAGMVPGGSIVDLRVNTVLDGISLELVYLPAYTVSYRYRDRTYRALVDGVSGLVSGDRPISGSRLAVAVGVFVVAPLALAYLIWRRRRL